MSAIVAVLTDPDATLSVEELRRSERVTLDRPGMYSWWVDEDGARDLSVGLQHRISAGVIYAGEAGATRWPSGKQSTSTLWLRLIGMHLGSRAEFSTFRRTLAAILRTPIRLVGEDDARLDAWMGQHLRVAVWPAPDPDTLKEVEAAVLADLDPPLNIVGMPVNPLRTRLKELRIAGRDQM